MRRTTLIRWLSIHLVLALLLCAALVERLERRRMAASQARASEQAEARELAALERALLLQQIDHEHRLRHLRARVELARVDATADELRVVRELSQATGERDALAARLGPLLRGVMRARSQRDQLRRDLVEDQRTVRRQLGSLGRLQAEVEHQGELHALLALATKSPGKQIAPHAASDLAVFDGRRADLERQEQELRGLIAQCDDLRFRPKPVDDARVHMFHAAQRVVSIDGGTTNGIQSGVRVALMRGDRLVGIVRPTVVLERTSVGYCEMLWPGRTPRKGDALAQLEDGPDSIIYRNAVTAFDADQKLIRVRLGTANGVDVGTMLSIRRRRRTIALARVTVALKHGCVAKVIRDRVLPIAGDHVEILPN